MKGTYKLWVYLLIILMSASFFACGAKANETYDVWLQRYEEKPIEIKNGVYTDYEWTSSDESIVTVENGKLIAQKTSKDGAVVVGKGKHGTITINVKRINDTVGKPYIQLQDSVAYVGFKVKLNPVILYNNVEVDVSGHNLVYNLNIDDTSIVEADGIEVKGLAEGKTNIAIETQYKGLTIKGTASLTVKPATYINVSKKSYSLVNTENEKVNSVQVEAEVCIDGQIVSSYDMNLEVVEGDQSIVLIEGRTITAQKEGSVTLRASLKQNAEISDNFVVKVNPPYEAETFEIADTTMGVVYESYSGNIGGRTEGVTRYVSGTHLLTPEGWSDIWPHRIVNTKIGGNLVDAYRKGYRFFSYDIYLSEPSRLLVGFTSGGITYDVPYDTYFYSSWVKILNEEGEVVNRVVEDRWLTVTYDLYAFILEYPSATLSFFYTAHNEGMEVFFSNICYRYDDSFITSESLNYQQEAGYVLAPNNEFHSYANSDNSIYEISKTPIDGVDGAYKLTGLSNNYAQNTMVAISSLGTTRGDALTRLSERGKFLVFDIYIEKATGIYFSILSKEVEFSATVGVTDFSKCDWISVIGDNKLQYALKQGQWQTISIDYESLILNSDMFSNNPIAIEFALMNQGDIAYINNVRYYEKGDFLPSEYNGIPPSGMKVLDDQKATLEDVLTGEFYGKVLYTDLGADQGSGLIFQEVQNGTQAGTFFAQGKKYIIFDFYLNNSVKSIEFVSSVERAGYSITNNSIVNVNESFVADGSLNVYDQEGKAVSVIQSGKWYKLGFYVEYMSSPEDVNVIFYVNPMSGGSASAYVGNLNLSEHPPYGNEAQSDFVNGWVNTSGDETSIIPVKSGEFAGAERYINWTQSDYSGVSFNAIKNGQFFANGYRYMNFDFYLTDDVSGITFFSWITSPTVKDTAFNQTIAINSNFAHNNRIFFFDENGESAHSLKANKWYTITVDMNYPSSPDWSFIYLRTTGYNGSTAYLKNFMGSNEMPYEWEEFQPITANALGFVGGTNTVVSDVTRDDEAVKKVESQDNGKIFFMDVINASGGKGEFFTSGYSFVIFEMYIESSSDFLFNTSTHNIWTNANGFDWRNIKAGESTQGNFLRTYNAEIVQEVLTKGKWYVVAMRVEGFSPEVSILSTGNSVYYMKNLQFANAFPTENLPEREAVGGLKSNSDNLGLEFMEEGAFANTVKVSSTGGDEWTNTFTFDKLYNSDGSQGEFFEGNYTKVCFEIYFDQGSTLSVKGNNAAIWWSSFGHSASENFGGFLAVEDEEGNAVLTLTSVSQHGSSQWYKFELTVGTDTDVSMGVGNGGSAYVRNVSFVRA